MADPTNFLDGSCNLSLRQLQAAQLRHMVQCPDLCLRLAGQIALRPLVQNSKDSDVIVEAKFICDAMANSAAALARVIASEPFGTRSEPVVNVPGA